MKKITLCLTLVLLLLVGCTAPAQTGGKPADATLPTLSGREPAELDVSPQRPETPTKPTPSEEGARPTLHRSDEETESENDGVTTVVVAEIAEWNRRKPEAKQTWSFALPAEGTKTFGETNPLTLSAVEDADGTVTVQLLTEDCFLLRDRLPKKVEHITLSFGNTVYITVRDNGTEVYYALWIE